MKRYNEFVVENQIDIDGIRKKIGAPSYKEMETQFKAGGVEFDPLESNTYTFEISIVFDGFEPTILEGKLEISNEDPTQDQIESKIKDRLKVFNNIVSYQVLSTEKSN